MKFLSRAAHLVMMTTLCVFVMSCGKKAIEKNSLSQQSQPQQTSELEAQLNQQELFCASDRSCPNYIAKVAVLYKGKLKFCTGFITDDNVIATASSCLPERLRSKDLPCDKDVFFSLLRPMRNPREWPVKK